MKKLLGSLLIFLQISAASYEWDVKIDKSNYYQEERFLTTFTCNFSDRSDAIYIVFKPKVKGFSFEKIDFSDVVRNGKRKVTYRFLTRAHNIGKQYFFVNALMRKTTDDSIRETVLGRDNDQDIEFVDTKIRTKKIPLTIKALPGKSKIVGSFSMDIAFSKETTLKAYEPLHIKIRIKGEGDFNALQPFNFEKKGRKVFHPLALKKYEVSEQGVKGTLVWQYALTSPLDINLSKQSIEYFDPKDEKVKFLHFYAKHFKVDAQVKVHADEKNYPLIEQTFNWGSFFSKIFYFLLGGLSLYTIQKFLQYKHRIPVLKNEFDTLNDLIHFLVKESSNEELLEDIENDIKNKNVKKLSYYVSQMKKQSK